MIVFLDGAYVPAGQARISVWDGGFMYGDGVYTTLRLYRGEPWDLDAHAERLQRHATALDLPYFHDETSLREIIAELVGQNGMSQADGRLRITVSRRGDPERPMPLDDLDILGTTLLITLGPLPQELGAWQRHGVGVIRLDAAYARGNFPELKTLNGLATLRSLRRAAAAGCPEAILTDRDGHLLEGAVSNLFLVRDERLLTPAKGEGFLAGRTRERVLQLARRLGIEAEEAILDTDAVACAEEIFLAGSVREILPVIAVDRIAVGAGRPGPLTVRLQEAYRELTRRPPTS